MHATLSLAALHLAYLNESDKSRYAVDAAHYHTQAVLGL